MNAARQRRKLIKQRANSVIGTITDMPTPEGWDVAYVRVRNKPYPIAVAVVNSIPGISIPAWIKRVAIEGIRGWEDAYTTDHIFIPPEQILKISIIDSRVEGPGEEQESLPHFWAHSR